MLVPETGIPATEGRVVIPKDELHKDENLIGAIARGTIDGGKLAMNVAIMLISFLALVALLDSLLAGRTATCISFRPAWGRFSAIYSRPWHGLSAFRGTTAWPSANLLGTRMALNEVIAYIALGTEKATLAPRSFYDCDVCVVRLCESGLNRHADRRDRRAGSGTKERSGEVWECARCWREPWRTLISASIAGMFLV